MVAVGEIVVDAEGFEDNADTLYAAADQVYKILMQGVTMGKTNAALQLFVASPEKQGDLNKRGAGYGGNVAGALIGTSGQTDAERTHNIPLWIDDTCGLRLEAAASMSSNMCIVTYMRVQ
tara:strand:+ start:166 stop:525 length:360 start_codon:yes stop_codon:yes gene_type:complete